MSIDVKELNRRLRATFWPAVKAHGFDERTDRVAWRYAGEYIDIVELQAVGQDATAVGCPPLSLSVYVAAYPPFLERDTQIPVREGRLRPHYWHCDPFSRSMDKTIAQPWFLPFSETQDKRMLPSFRLHLEALSKLVDRTAHDVPDIWYMRDDGSNMDQNLEDLTAVVLSSGMYLLDQFHDPQQVLDLIRSGSLLNAESPRAFYLTEAIEAYLTGAGGTTALER
jgi:hypothetical protein